MSGLAQLDAVRLEQAAAARLDGLTVLGDPAWRARKRAEARDVLALAQIAPATLPHIEVLDARTDLRVMLAVNVPVPCLAPGAPDLAVAGHAVLGIVYPRQSVVRRRPGHQFVQVLEPRSVWHANVHSGPVQPLCLGSLPAGIRVTELILLSYRALAMQDAQVDELDAAGVLNVEAARWWQNNSHRMPLTDAPFLHEGEA